MKYTFTILFTNENLCEVCKGGNNILICPTNRPEYPGLLLGLYKMRLLNAHRNGKVEFFRWHPAEDMGLIDTEDDNELIEQIR